MRRARPAAQYCAPPKPAPPSLITARPAAGPPPVTSPAKRREPMTDGTTPAVPADHQQAAGAGLPRSTRHRQDPPDFPRRPVSGRTPAKLNTPPAGTRYRPSMFLPLPCDSYGRVRDDGPPADPGSYDYQRAA